MTRPPQGTATGGSERILVVDDDDVVRRAVVRALKTYGYRVSAAADGREALGLIELEGRRFALVIADAVMPNHRQSGSWARCSFSDSSGRSYEQISRRRAGL